MKNISFHFMAIVLSSRNTNTMKYIFFTVLKMLNAQISVETRCDTIINATRLEEIIFNLNIVRPPGSAGLDQGMATIIYGYRILFLHQLF